MGKDRKAEHDVFISYAHEDHDFVRKLKTWLTDAGLDVWIDEERMRAGEGVEEVVRAALKISQHAVFVLSKSWLASEFCNWELRGYHDEHKKRPKIVVLRSRIKELDFPSTLSGRFRLEWLEDGAAYEDAQFWRLYSALRGDEKKGLGDPNEWPRLGREARSNATADGGSVLPSWTEEERIKKAANRLRWGPSRAALRCDRDEQWKAIEDHADLKWHEALFIQGANHEAPELFLEALQQCYPEKPKRRIVPVAWDSGRLPTSKAQFFDELARALGCSVPALVRSLGEELRKHFLVLVHRPQFPTSLRSNAVVRYYTRHLPELIRQVGPTANFLKLVQGIVWAGAEQPDAEAWIDTMKSDPALPIVPIEALSPITPKKVESWSKTLPPSTDREAIVTRVLKGATTSAIILSRIIEECRNLKGNP